VCAIPANRFPENEPFGLFVLHVLHVLLSSVVETTISEITSRAAASFIKGFPPADVSEIDGACFVAA